MCYCLMALVGKGIQLAVFGELRVSETQVSIICNHSLKRTKISNAPCYS